MYKSNKSLSSLVHQSPFFTFGFKILIHLSLHYLPVLPAIILEAYAHLDGPSLSTHPFRIISSSKVQGPFISPGLSCLLHLCKHWIGVRPLMY